MACFGVVFPRQRTGLCNGCRLFICVFIYSTVSEITETVVSRFGPNFQGRRGGAKDKPVRLRALSAHEWTTRVKFLLRFLHPHDLSPRVTKFCVAIAKWGGDEKSLRVHRAPTPETGSQKANFLKAPTYVMHDLQQLIFAWSPIQGREKFQRVCHTLGCAPKGPIPCYCPLTPFDIGL